MLLGSSVKDSLMEMREPLKTAARKMFPASRLNILDDALRSWRLTEGWPSIRDRAKKTLGTMYRIRDSSSAGRYPCTKDLTAGLHRAKRKSTSNPIIDANINQSINQKILNHCDYEIPETKFSQNTVQSMNFFQTMHGKFFKKKATYTSRTWRITNWGKYFATRSRFSSSFTPKVSG